MAEWTLAKIVERLESRDFHEDMGGMRADWLQDDSAFIALKDIAKASEPSTMVHFATYFDKLMRRGYCW